MHAYTQRGSALSVQLREKFREDMLKKLEKKPWIADHRTSCVCPFSWKRSYWHCAVIPSFSVSCRRLTPGPGYLEALVADNVGLGRPYLGRH